MDYNVHIENDKRGERMKKEVIEEMNNFAIRILKGKENVHPQEIAILPEILHILKNLSEEESDRKGN